MDNGKEFKGAVLILLKRFGVRIINGRPRRPQTQGLVEQANGFAKSKLGTYLTEIGTRKWAAALPGIAMQINDCPHDLLPHGRTGFEVMMSRRIHRADRAPIYDRVELAKISDKEIDIYCSTDTSNSKGKARAMDTERA